MRQFPKIFKLNVILFLGIVLNACHPTANTLAVDSNTDQSRNNHFIEQKTSIKPQHLFAQVTDSSGQLVSLKQPAQRIVCLFESGCDALYMLRQGSKIVGIPARIYQQSTLYDAYSILDPRIKAKKIATPSQGSNSTNIESLLLLQPDLVIMGSGEKQSTALLRQLGIPVYIMESETYNQVKEEFYEISLLTGSMQRAKKILEYSDEKIKKIAQDTTQEPYKQTIYYAWSGGRIFSTSGTQSITNDFITLAGAKNIVQTPTNQPNVNPETLIEWNPDNIVLWDTNPELIYQRPELKLLKAVQQQKVFNLSPTFIYNPHTIKIILTALYLNQHMYSKQHHSIEQTQYDVLNTLYGDHAARALLSL